MGTHHRLAIAFLCLIASVAAQQPNPSPQPSPASSQQSTGEQEKALPRDEDVVRITTNLVQVDAVVTDKSGKHITDLRPDEIRIFEDGRAQKVTNFSYIMANTENPRRAETTDKVPSPEPPVTLRPDQVRRTIALVVDDLGVSFESTYFVRRGLKKFVDEQMQPGDLVSIVRTSGGIGALQQFTSDKRLLYAAIERIKWNANGRSGLASVGPIQGDSLHSEEVLAANEELNQFREDVFAAGTLGAVGYVVRGLRQMPGRKSILLISDGFTIYSRDDPSRNFRALDSMRRLIDQASRASVVIYTINATGLATLSLNAADAFGAMSPSQIEQLLLNRRTTAFDSQDGLSYLAQETGGLAIRNSNDLGRGIRRVLEDQRGYYLIGYRPEEATFDRTTGQRTFHKLNLKVLRPGKFEVRMRNGFYGVTDEEVQPLAQSKTRQQILTALLSPFGAAGVHIRLTALFGNDPKIGSLARSMLHISASDLTFVEDPDGWRRADFDVVAVTLGDNGHIIDQTARSHTLRVRGQAYQEVLRDGFVYFVTVPIKQPGAYQLRAALRDHGSERVGSASQFIEIPDVKKKRLALSSLILTGGNPANIKKPASGNSGQQSEGEEVANATYGAAVRRFDRGNTVNYGFVIYNARIDKAGSGSQLQVQIRLSREGKTVFIGKEQPYKINNQSDLKRLGVGGSIVLGSEMSPGEYVFEVIVTDFLADEKQRVASQWIDFEIAK